jgi:formylglycine-generating enzyme required for sulfatase activity
MVGVRSALKKILILWVLMVCFYACSGSGNGDTTDNENIPSLGGETCIGAYHSHLVFPDDVPRSDSAQNIMDASGNYIDCEAAGISSISFKFYDEADALLSEASLSCSASSDLMENVSCGDHIKVSLSIENSYGETLFEGESTDVSITQDRVTEGNEIVLAHTTPVDQEDDGSTDQEDDGSSDQEDDGTGDQGGDGTIDQDGDGYDSTQDCDDQNSAIHPAALDIPGNGIDEDCDGLDAEAPPIATSDFFTIDELGMRFNRIPAGTFIMGSLGDEAGRDSDEIRHEVTLSRDFYMQTTEVTQGQWMEIMGPQNPSGFSNCGANCPVERISWQDTQDFIASMNARFAGLYSCRLPTKAEWEYAAQAGSNDAFSSGDIVADNPYSCEYDINLDAMGYYCGNAQVTYTGCYNATGIGGFDCVGPHPVGTKLPNDFGLYDMHGNVWEWVADWYAPYPNGSVVDPQGPSGQTEGASRVLRGGSWYYVVRSCRASNRSYMESSDYRLHYNGFRVVCAQVGP